MHAETKVGLFVVLGLVVLFASTLWVEDFRLFKQTYTLVTYFDTVAGVPERSQVRVAGLQGGRVRSMGFEEGRIRVEMEIEERIRIHEDSLATISSDSIVGSRYITISLGTPGARQLKDGDVVPSKDSTNLEQLVEHLDGLIVSAKSFVDDINVTQEEISGRLKELVDENSPKVSQAMDSFTAAGDKVNRILETVQGIVTSIDVGEGTIGKLVRDDTLYERANILTENLSGLTADLSSGDGFLAQLVKDKDLFAKFDGALTAMAEVSNQIRNGTGTLAMLVNDDATYRQLQQIAGNFVDISDRMNTFLASNEGDIAEAFRSLGEIAPKLESSVRDMNEIMAKVNSGEGTLGKLVNDPSLYDEANQAVKEVRQALESMQDQAPLATFTGVAAGALR